MKSFSFRKGVVSKGVDKSRKSTMHSKAHILLVYVEYCQRAQPLLTHSASKRGFQSLHVASVSTFTVVMTGF